MIFETSAIKLKHGVITHERIHIIRILPQNRQTLLHFSLSTIVFTVFTLDYYTGQ
jgi:hypothetical protein